MIKKILQISLLAIVGLVALPKEAAAQTRDPRPTFAQRQSYAQLNRLLRSLRPGDSRVLSIARRMMNLNPLAITYVARIATQRLITTQRAQQLSRISIAVISSFRWTTEREVALLVNTVDTIATVAQTIPRIVATSPLGTDQSTDTAIRLTSVNSINFNPRFADIVQSDAIPQILPQPPIPAPTPTPVPYGA